MKKVVLFFSLLLAAVSVKSQTNPGDTIVMQTFTFGSLQDDWFTFPSDTIQFEKVIMKYKLKCNSAQTPACGEWDYLTNTYVYHPTGLLDSSVINQPTIVVNSASPDSVAYSYNPTYSYDTSFQYFMVNTSTVSLTTSIIGAGGTTTNAPFGAALPVSRTQYLWKASEMSAAGMTMGNITGLQFYLQSLGGQLRNLTIKIKSTALDSLTTATFSAAGFTTVYMQNTLFSATGWNALQLTTPFNWNGTSNLIVEITYDNLQASTNNALAADTTTLFKSGLINAGSDRAVSANAGGHIDIPLNPSVAALDSFITVAYWAYGDVSLQPMDGTCFEAVDSINQRVINAHMPWSDANVYWDAGNVGGSYDRINKVATLAEYEGNWNYWAFTKNVATGSMKIYLNGVLWHSGTGKTRRMKNIKKFRLAQGNWGGSNSYAGRMDEFTVFNKELSLAEITTYMNQPITTADPNFSNLAVHFNFNDGNYVTAADSASGNHGAALFSGIQNPLKPASEMISGFAETKIRPQITFEQGVYVSYLDSVSVIDSTLNVPFVILAYNDSVVNPSVATDTLVGWPVVANGIADSTIYLSSYSYYNVFPEIDRFELARYITPYGNGLSLGTGGWTWTFDVSDYITLLHDSVHLSAGNWQELLDVQFLMIVGTPPRDVIGIENLWNGNFDYGNAADPIENYLPALNVNIPANAVNSRWKSRVTGHGMDSPGNCAEFCPKNHYYNINNNLEYTQLAWRDNCDLNPLYPQGGTWVYDRSNWCPGAEVWTYDFELTPFVTAGDTAVLNHDVQPYTHTSGWDYWQIEDQVVYYSAPNFTLDASLEDILSPTKDQMWARYNPICTNPIIKIKNTGSATLTSLTITYGLVGSTPSVYTWTGSLAFLESETVTLGNFAWSTAATDFSVTLSNPNGGTDQYQYNNARSNPFTFPMILPSKFVIQLQTNTNYWENVWTLKNSAGTVIASRSGAAANTTYKDTVDLPSDCYEFELLDSGEDGLSWWANTGQGNGSMRFRSATNGTILKNFGADFGGQIYQQLNVGLNVGINQYVYTDRDVMNVYPNPSNGHVNIDVNLATRDDGTIKLYDLMGKTVYTRSFKDQVTDSFEADFSYLSKGIYYVTLRTKNKLITKKLILN
ncbi:MAG: T9SS type A sorting domain-containing protein [Bacteroidia bacterium]|nr:T9SS type A sorting domain-containing protein [Bacteroidia bacterium]